MSFAVSLNVPQAVGKSSGLTKELTEGQEGSERGKERSWIMRSLVELGLGTSPRGEVMKWPMRACSSSGE